MSIYSEAPDARPFSDDKPTLLVSWWITIFCMAIIVLRLCGRYVRVEKLLREDKIVAGALLPLLLRAICVHFVLKYGTNNVNLDSIDLTQDQINKRVIGSRLVMASRVFYAATYVLILQLATSPIIHSCRLTKIFVFIASGSSSTPLSSSSAASPAQPGKSPTP